MTKQIRILLLIYLYFRKTFQQLLWAHLKLQNRRCAILTTGTDKPCQSTSASGTERPQQVVGQVPRVGLTETQQPFLKTQHLGEGLVSLN